MVKKFRIITLMNVAIIAIALYFLSQANFVRDSLATEIQSTNDTQAQAMTVEITIIEEQTTRLWKEFSGHLTAVDYVEIRPQASGIITEVKFWDGQFITKGQVLYVIDPRSMEAIIAQKNADLIAAQNHSALADKKYQRIKNMLRKKVISQQIYDESMNRKLVANSNVKRAEAELSEAKINLSYAYIKSPISGRISRTELTEGNLVSAGPNAPLLTTIVSGERIYAEFEVDEQTYSRYVSSILSEHKSRYKNPVELRLQSDDTVYQGIIHAFDNRIDPASGTIRARAIFDNSQGKLLPGMYARLRLGSVSKEKTIRISERAIGTDQNRKFVYIVDSDKKTAYREVHLGDSINGDRIIHSGLAVGDKVIVHGLMRIQPKMLVNPKVTTIEKTEAARL